MNTAELITAVILDLLLILAWAVPFLKEKRRGDYPELSGLKQLTVPAGAWLEKIFRNRSGGSPGKDTIEKRKHRILKPSVSSEKDEIHRLMTDLSGKEEGERQYFLYRSGRWGSLLLTLSILLALFLAVQAAQRSRDSSLDPVLTRPSYGEGDEKTRVTMQIEAEDSTVEKSFTLTVPEKEADAAEAQAVCEEAVSAIREALDGKVICGDLSLPTELTTDGGTAVLTYRSLTPKKLRSTGEVLADPGQERQELSMEVTASLGTASSRGTVAMQLAALREFSAEDRAESLEKAVLSGVYTGEDAVMLPEETAEGEKVTWRKTEEKNTFLWALLFVLIPALILAKQDADYRQLSEKRLAEIRSSYPELIGELTILMGAGLSLPLAWERLGKDYRRQKENTHRSSMLMEEVSRTGLELEEGVPVREALLRFSDRIPVKEVRRFINLLTQNLRRGDAYVLTRLKELADEAWEARKKLAREKSEEVDTKLMLPLMMLLVVVLIIVISPAIMELS